MILKEQLEEWESIYSEIKHPYTEKNRSFLLFRIGLSLLLLSVTIIVLMDILEVVAKTFTAFSMMNPLHLANIRLWVLVFFIGLVLFSLGIHYRKKW